jgi:hypothetical protein
MTKEFLCDSCYYAEIKVVEYYKPLWASSSLVNKVQHLNVWCTLKYIYVRKLVNFEDRKKCGYKPKAGKIGKKLYQKQLGE